MKTHRQLRNLHEAYVYATEVQLESLRDLVSFPARGTSRIAHQRATCLGMLRWCASALVNHDAVDWGPRHARRFPCVSEILANASIESALDGWIGRWRRPVSNPVTSSARPRIRALPLAAPGSVR